MISVKDLTKTYSGKVPTQALRGVSFSVDAGEFIAIMGRSGSGKSTLLHQLGLLDIPTSGTIAIDGKNVLDFSEKEKTSFRLNELGYVFQEYALLPELTALETTCLPLMMRGIPKNTYISKAKDILEKVGLGKRFHHLPHELSGGEQQRVAIARALANDPKILFADEPCANLDSESSQNILDLLKALNSDLGQTIVMVTHEAEDKKFVNRTIWLKDGLVEKVE